MGGTSIGGGKASLVQPRCGVCSSSSWVGARVVGAPPRHQGAPCPDNNPPMLACGFSPIFVWCGGGGACE
jgi:hypothetical protein